MAARVGLSRRRLWLTAFALAIAAIGWLFARYERATPAAKGPSAALEAAVRDRAEGTWIEDSGEVVRSLRDDREGSPHQRFVLAVAGGRTLLVAHNLDLAPRAPVEVGDRVRFRGRYEWNELGGVVHWTHDDGSPGSGGWLEVGGKRYE